MVYECKNKSIQKIVNGIMAVRDSQLNIIDAGPVGWASDLNDGEIIDAETFTVSKMFGQTIIRFK
jgi:hypothetical protein